MLRRIVCGLAAALLMISPAYADDVKILEQKAVEILDKVTHAIEVSAQPTAEAVLAAVWFEGFAGIIAGFAGMALLGALLCSASYLGKRAVINIPDYSRDILGMLQAVGAGLAGLVSIPVFVDLVWNNLTSPYNWAAIFNPPAAIALKLINAL